MSASPVATSAASSGSSSPTERTSGGRGATALDAEPYVQVTVGQTGQAASAHANGGKKEVNWNNHPALPTGSAVATPAATPFSIKSQLAMMLKGGVIMDVTNVEEARIAEAAGACAVMALERVPSDIRRDGGVARMSHPAMIRAIQAAVSIPVMAKVRVGHFVEAQILQALDVDFIDESEVLTPADDKLHILKSDFAVPFVCGCRNLGEALRRIQEGAAMIRTKGEAGTGNVVEAVRHARQVADEVRKVLAMRDPLDLAMYAREIGVEVASLRKVQECGRLPVVQFAAGGVATPADAALMMQLGMDGVFVGSGVFKSSNPAAMAAAMVQAVTHFRDPKKLAEISETVGEAMKGLEIDPSKIVLFATREQP